MPNKDMIPIEVIILTDTDDIKGTVFVSSTVAANRQLTELLNDNNRRFLAVTNVEIYAKNSNQPPKRMVHPTSQALFRESPKTQEDIARFRELRAKLNQTKPF